MSRWFVVPSSSQNPWEKDPHETTKDIHFGGPMCSDVKDWTNYGLHDIPNEIFKDIYVSKLIFPQNNLTQLPQCVAELRLITHVDFSHNKFISFPSVLVELPYLKILVISHNLLSTIPDDFGKLQRLEELNISRNKFRQFPNSVCRNASILSLVAHGNHFLSLPKEIGLMTSLRLLDLRKTGLTELPDSLQHLVNLEILRLDGNPLHTPPLCVASRGLAHVMAFLVLHSLGYRRNCFGRQPSERKVCCGLCETEDVGFKNPVRSAADSDFSSLDRRSYTSLPGHITVEKHSLPRNSVKPQTAAGRLHGQHISPELSPTRRYRPKDSSKARPDSGYSTFGCSGGNAEPMKPYVSETSPVQSRAIVSAENTSTLKIFTRQDSIEGQRTFSAQQDTSVEDELEFSDAAPSEVSEKLDLTGRETRRSPTTVPDRSMERTTENNPQQDRSHVPMFQSHKPHRYNNAGEKHANESHRSTRETHAAANPNNQRTPSDAHLSPKILSRTKPIAVHSGSTSKLPGWMGTKPEESTHVHFLPSRRVHQPKESTECTTGNREPRLEESSVDSDSNSKKLTSPRLPANRDIATTHVEKTNPMQRGKSNAQDRLPQRSSVNMENRNSRRAAANQNGYTSSKQAHVTSLERLNSQRDLCQPSIPHFGGSQRQKPSASKNRPTVSRVGVSLFIPPERAIRYPAVTHNGHHSINFVQNIGSKESIVWDSLTSADLERIYRLKEILETGLNCQLPRRPEELVIVLRSGVHLADWLRRMFGPTSNIRVYDPAVSMRTSDMIKYFRVNLRRCRELMEHHCVPKEHLFSIEDLLNTKTPTGILSLATSVLHLCNILAGSPRSPKHHIPKRNQQDDSYTKSECKLQSTTPSARHHYRKQPDIHSPRPRSTQSSWPQHLCSDV
ncbi:hypothetical protein CRM22_006857 [Opisthorchis felineus]|uniref:Calponin-homology (CH) domain-containing protein n=1 Tax=Opisthorchis felineus TaxID=147828 RepID=A0A4V3SE78_OPIFE|nr:hypothetical protein CRM22_006857 [Opisthorchis felineus]